MARQLPPQFIEDWGSGVITSLEPDQLPQNASPRGWNSLLVSASGDKAVPAKRKGFETLNATAITGNPAVHGISMFKRRTVGAGSFTRYILLVSDNGRLDKLNDDGTTAAYDNTLATPFAAGDTPPEFCLANNEMFVVNGERNRKATYDSPNERVYAVGLTRPNAPTLNAIAGPGMTGTYDIRLSFRNSYTNHESSSSNTTSITLANQILRVTIPAAVVGALEKADKVRIGIRKTSIQSEFYFLTEVAIGSGTYDINQTDNQLLALTTLMPTTTENEPPPVLSTMAWHNERAFAVSPSNPSNLLFSQLNFPEAFDPENYESVGLDDGEGIVKVVSAFGILVIFKSSKMYALYGDEPQSWRIEVIDPTIGTVSPRSVQVHNGILYWWDRSRGLMSWTGEGAPIPFGQTLISTTLSVDNLRYSQLNRVCSGVAPTEYLILWGVNELSPEGEPTWTKNNIIIPFNTRLQRFVSDKWNPFDVASMTTVEDSNGRPWLYVGGIYGQVFKYGTVDADGVESGTKSGTVTSSTNNTLTDSGASFNVTGAGLKGRYVYVTAPGGLSVQRRRITSNTGTQLTLDTGLAWSTNPTNLYTYAIGGPDWQWDTANLLPVNAFWNCRLRFLFSQLKTSATESVVNIDLLFNYSSSIGAQLSLTVRPGGALWDSATWDVSTFGAQSAKSERQRIGATAHAVRARYRNNMPDEPLTLLKSGIQGEVKNERLGQ